MFLQFWTADGRYPLVLGPDPDRAAGGWSAET